MLFKYPVVVLLSCLTLVACAGMDLASLLQGEQRIALVIGNGDYHEWETLKSPISDASKMKQTLKEVGFDVIYRENANQHEMEGAIREFKKRLADTAPKRERVGLFYYSGHGVLESQGNICLAAIDAPNLSSAKATASANLKGFVALASLYKEINQLNRAGMKTRSLFILDNCRTPVEKKLLISCNQTGTGGVTPSGAKGSKGVPKKGLGWHEDSNPKPSENNNSVTDNSDPKLFSEPDDSLTASATRRYQAANDGGEGQNSPYTRLLLELIKEPKPLREILKIVGEKMDRETSGQKPVINGDTGGGDDFYFRPPSPPPGGFK